MTPRINWKPSVKDLRQFGLILWIGFGLIAGAVWWKGHPETARWLWGVSGSIGLLAILVPRAAQPFYYLWMGFGFVMGSIMSRLVLGLIFFGLITPMAMFFRVRRRDVLWRRKPADIGSFWQDHEDIPKSNYSRLF